MVEEKEPLMDDGLRKLPKERRSSFKRTAIILAAVLAVTLAVVIVLICTRPKVEEPEQDRYVVNIDEEPISVTVTQLNNGVRLAEESYTLIQKDGEWVISGDDKELDSSAVGNITDSTVLRASRIIDDSPSDKKLNEFGLKNPIRSIRFDFKNKSSVTLLMGRRVTADGGFYAKLSNKREVYLISDVEGEWLMSAKSDLVKKPIIVPAEAQSAIDSVTVKRNGEFFRIERTDEVGINYNYWSYSAPIGVLCDDEKVSDFLTELTALTPDEYVSEDKKAEYGLKHPFLTVVLTSYGNSYGLEVGAKTEDGKYRYCCFNNGDVFKIEISALATLEQFGGMTLLQSNISKYHINFTDRIRIFDQTGDLADITVKHKTQKTDGKETESSWEVLNGKTLDASVFSQFYISFLNASYDGVLPKGKTVGNAVFGYELTLKDNKKVLVEFLENDAYSKAVRVNGSTYYYILDKQIEVMKEKTKLLAEGKLQGA